MDSHAEAAGKVGSAADTAHPNQFALLGQRRFAPFFWTQFLGAGNDNLFKFALTVLVTYQLQVSWLPSALAGLAIGALFILPFLLFSATSGQLADKYDKAAPDAPRQVARDRASWRRRLGLHARRRRRCCSPACS